MARKTFSILDKADKIFYICCSEGDIEQLIKNKCAYFAKTNDRHLLNSIRLNDARKDNLIYATLKIEIPETLAILKHLDKFLDMLYPTEKHHFLATFFYKLKNKFYKLKIINKSKNLAKKATKSNPELFEFQNKNN